MGVLRRLRRLSLGLIVVVVCAGTTASSRGTSSLRVHEGLLSWRHLQGGRLHWLLLRWWNLQVVVRHLRRLVAHVLSRRRLALTLRLRAPLVHDETALIAFVGLPDGAYLRRLSSRRLLLLLRLGRAEAHVGIIHIASRGLVELLVLLILRLEQLAADGLALCLLISWLRRWQRTGSHITRLLLLLL